MRAVFLPSLCDPYVLALWWRNCQDFWLDEVDQVYIYLNSPIQPEVVIAIEKIIDNPKVKILYEPKMLDHGPALVKLLQATTEDYLMFMEEDAFVIKKGEIDKQFKLLENDVVDLIGSPRGSTQPEFTEFLSKRLNIDLTRRPDVGAGFWPNFFFAKRSDLLKTDLHFQAKSWNMGDYEPLIDYTFTQLTPADTFVWASVQLRGLGLKVREVRQYHCNPYWENDLRTKANNFDPDCPWFHCGSLSTGITGMLVAENGWPLATYHQHPESRKMDVGNQPHLEYEYLEYQRRVAFCRLGWELFGKDLDLPEFSKEYEGALLRIRDHFLLDAGDIEMQKNAYRKLLQLE